MQLDSFLASLVTQDAPVFGEVCVDFLAGEVLVQLRNFVENIERLQGEWLENIGPGFGGVMEKGENNIVGFGEATPLARGEMWKVVTRGGAVILAEVETGSCVFQKCYSTSLNAMFPFQKWELRRNRESIRRAYWKEKKVKLTLDPGDDFLFKSHDGLLHNP